MKKIICVIILCMIPVLVFAETDLSGMSYDDLIALQRQVTAEIMSRPEWKEVEVPAGEYVVGVDIPAGSYSLTASKMTTIVKYKRPDDPLRDSIVIGLHETVNKFNLPEGTTIFLENPLIFAPPKGLDF